MRAKECGATHAAEDEERPRGNGGIVEDVTYENIMMKNVKVAIFITSYYPSIPKEPQNDPAQEVTPKTPIWRNIRISNLKAEGGAEAGRIFGLPEMPVSDVELHNVQIQASKGLRVTNAKGIRFTDSSITAASGPSTMIDKAEVTGLDMPAK